MPEFLKLIPPQEALDLLLGSYSQPSRVEEIETESSLGRVTSLPIIAPHALPSFKRSTVDGYAVIAADTHGASETLPVYLSIIGEVPMGDAPGFRLSATKCMEIHTGGMLPKGADAVIMLEHTQQVKPDEVEILRSVADGENVLHIGEDVQSGQAVIPSGTRIRPAEVGGLMALGITRLQVRCKPKVGIISSGDEVIPPGSNLSPGRVRDINSYTLAALVEDAGGYAVRYGIIPDQLEAMIISVSQALEECDMVVITAGSSASSRDLTAQVINELGDPGVLVHGVNVKPGKPTILGICEGKPVIGLPGNPVSALVIASLFVVPVVDMILGVKISTPRPYVLARITINISSIAGREDWVAVRLIKNEVISSNEYVVEPVFGKSNLIFTLSRADGLVLIPADVTGLNAGDLVEVFLL